jgi:hypothetical protein
MHIGPAESPRNRMSVALRIIYLIPHLIVLYFYQLAAAVVAIAHWFVIVFTGRRNDSMYDFTVRFLGYYGAVAAYGSLLHDRFPAFGATDAGTPVGVTVRRDDRPANRVTVGFRWLLVFPAGIISAVLGFAAQVVVIVSWFVIVFTGEQPDGMRQFVAKVTRYTVQVNGYALLLTDEYPWPSATGFSA